MLQVEPLVACKGVEPSYLKISGLGIIPTIQAIGATLSKQIRVW